MVGDIALSIRLRGAMAFASPWTRPGEPSSAAGASGAREAAAAPEGTARSPASPPRVSPRRGERTPIYSSSPRNPARTKGLSWSFVFAGWVPSVPFEGISLCYNDLRHLFSCYPGRRCPPIWTLSRYYRTTGNPLLVLQQTHDLARVSVAVQLRFLEYRDAITRYLETSAPRRDQLDLDVGPSLPQLRCQPGSAWPVVSKSAVFDRDFHGVPGSSA